MSTRTEDYHLKGGITTWILTLKSSGSYPRFSKKTAGQNPNLKNSPTTLRSKLSCEVEDYE